MAWRRAGGKVVQSVCRWAAVRAERRGPETGCRSVESMDFGTAEM